MALTKEEEKELASLESEFSSDDAAELAQLESELGEAPTSAPQAPEEGDITQSEAFGLGAVEGVPFAKDIAAGVTAAVDEFADEDFSIEDFKERYNREADSWNDQINKAETAFPKTFMAGDIAGGVGSMFIPGLKAAKGLKGAIAIGAASGLSRSEDRLTEQGAIDMLAGASLGAAGHGIAIVGGKAANAAGSYFKKMSDRFAGSYTSRYGGKASQEIEDHVSKFYGKGRKFAKVNEKLDLKKRIGESASKRVEDRVTKAQATQLFGEDLNTYGAIKVGDSLDDTALRFKNTKELFGTKKSKILKSIDDSSKESWDRVDLHAKYSQMAKSWLQKDGATPDHQKIYKGIQEHIDTLVNLDKDGIPIPQKWTTVQLDDFRQGLDKKAQSFNSIAANPLEKNSSEYFSKMASQVRGEVDEFVEGALVKNGVDAGEFLLAKRDYANTHLMEKLTQKQAIAPANDTIWGQIQNSVATKRVLLAGGVAVNPALGAGLIAADLLQSSGKLNNTMSAGLSTLSKQLKSNPNSPWASRFNRAILAPFATTEYLDDEMSVAMASAKLSSSPIERTNEAAIRNANAISALLRDKDPQLAKAFNNAIEEQDEATISGIMDQLSRDPNAQHLIQKGQGWNGKFQNVEDAKMAESELDSDDGTMSYAQRLLHKEALRKNQIIPQPKPEQPRFFQYKSNKGAEPDY
jgi:hypothetical protein